jgi:hypothetical protein
MRALVLAFATLLLATPLAAPPRPAPALRPATYEDMAVDLLRRYLQIDEVVHDIARRR